MMGITCSYVSESSLSCVSPSFASYPQLQPQYMQIRATVDNRRMAESLGINVDRLFTITFAFGSGMAALGGGLGAEFLGLDPQYALKYLVYFLIVVAVGGLGQVTGVFYASLLIGILDFALKLYIPKGGTMFIFALTILLLLLRPQGLFKRAAT